MRKISIKEGREHVVKFMEDAKRRQEERDKETELWEDLKENEMNEFRHLIEKEIEWGENIHNTNTLSNQQRRYFIKGLRQALFLYEKMVESQIPIPNFDIEPPEFDVVSGLI